MIIRRLSATIAVAGTCIALVACGGSEKPAYCKAVTDFKDSVSALTDVQVTENGVSSLAAAVSKVQSSGKTLVSEAKSAFGTEATALDASLTALGATARQLADPNTAKAALLVVPTQISAVKTSFDALSNAVKSKCD